MISSSSILVVFTAFTVSVSADLSQKLIGEIGKEPSGNWLVAPVSLSSGLGMLYLGAKLKTASEIATQLSLPSDHEKALESLKQTQQELILDDSSEGKGVSWELANKILVSKDIPLKESIKKEIMDIFSPAVIDNADFNNGEKIAQDVNDWVKKTTKGNIEELLNSEDCPSDTKMILLNAIYFKGSWKTEFNEAATEKDCFYVKANDCTEVDMMKSKNFFQLGTSKTLKSELIQIPYANSNYSMVIILPEEGVALSEVSEAIKTADFKKEIGELRKKQATLTLPKFAFEYGVEMSQSLSEIGMPSMFSSSADFSGFSDVNTPLKVGKIVHKAKITVNEAGTEAAGATGAMVFPRMGHIDSFDFEVNRPFTFLIYHGEGHILFCGQVLDPTK